MTHAIDCSAVVPCQDCSNAISNAREARHLYSKAMEALDELGSMPWLITDGGSTTERFWQVYEALRDLESNASRLIPRLD